jgi:predicted enzyme related to lactoylglutathione lyase
MIQGIHALIYTKEAEAVRKFFRDVLGFPSVDAGHGWLIFALPPAELGIHPTEDEPSHEIYLMCDNLDQTVKQLEQKGVTLARPITDAGFGMVTTIRLPGGSELGIYQPKHPIAIKTSS